MSKYYYICLNLFRFQKSNKSYFIILYRGIVDANYNSVCCEK